MQRSFLFSLPSALTDGDASEWRAAWVAAGIGDYEAWNAQRVVARGERLWIIPSNPVAIDWIMPRLDAIAAVVAARAGDVVPLEIRDRAVSVRAEPDRLHAYRFPRLVVAKGGGDWQPHFEDTLDPAIGDKIIRSVENALRRELTAWGRLPAFLANGERFLALSAPGRATVIPAVQGQRSGHGKPVHMLVRLNLSVLSPLRIEGDLFAGPLASLGFGRLLRGEAPAELDRATQRSLLALPTFDTESAP